MTDSSIHHLPKRIDEARERNHFYETHWKRVGLELLRKHLGITAGMTLLDYGYMATRKGIKVIQSGRFLGVCGRNALAGSWRDKGLSRAERWKRLNSPKGLPFREWMEFNRRNSGLLWPLRTITPSIRVMLGL